MFGVEKTIKLDSGIPTNKNVAVDVSDVFLHANFSVLVRFVENVYFKTHFEQDMKGVNTGTLTHYDICKRLLELHIREEDGNLRKILSEIYSLYVWYRESRGLRKDPYQEVAYMREMGAEQHELLYTLGSLQKKYYEEDTSMLERLMRIREQLVFDEE